MGLHTIEFAPGWGMKEAYWTQCFIWTAALMVHEGAGGWLMFLTALSLALCLVSEYRDYLKRKCRGLSKGSG